MRAYSVFFIMQTPATIYVVQAFVFALCILRGAAQQDLKNYGPYAIVWQVFETCKGPKQSECGKFEIENVQNMSDVVFRLDFPKDCPATMGKVIVSSKNNNVTKKLWNYVLKDPCQHFVMGPILIESFNLTKNCKINKGQYEIHLDMRANSMKFFGTNFFYGTYILQVTTYNKISNFFCAKSVIDIVKKK